MKDEKRKKAQAAYMESGILSITNGQFDIDILRGHGKINEITTI